VKWLGIIEGKSKMSNGRMDNGQPDETITSESQAMTVTETNTREDHPKIEVPFGSAKMLMLAIHHAHEAEMPLRGLQLHSDDYATLKALVEIAYVTQDALSDLLGITTNGRLFIGLKPEGVLDLPVEVAEVTGNIAETELLARYVEGKIAAIDQSITMGEAPRYSMQVSWEESYQHCALTLRALADEIRMGLHIPAVHLEGRVIYYNEDRSTGISHADTLRRFFVDVNTRNVKAGWWTNIDSGEPLKRSVGEMFILIVTELVEAYKAWLFNEADDKLPHFPGVGVEIGDLLIRVADFCGGLQAGLIVGPSETFNPGDQMFKEIVEIAERYETIRKTPEAKGEPESGDFLPSMDVAPMVDEKLAFNANRPDHKIENRLKEDGKRT
jgi:hypothetical protein